jgi:hypothetical protein
MPEPHALSGLRSAARSGTRVRGVAFAMSAHDLALPRAHRPPRPWPPPPPPVIVTLQATPSFAQGGSDHGNNGVGNALDPQPPGNPPINDGPGTGPGNPGNQGGAH